MFNICDQQYLKLEKLKTGTQVVFQYFKSTAIFSKPIHDEDKDNKRVFKITVSMWEEKILSSQFTQNQPNES